MASFERNHSVSKRSLGLSTCFKSVSYNHPLFEPIPLKRDARRFDLKSIEEFNLKKSDVNKQNRVVQQNDHIE